MRILGIDFGSASLKAVETDSAFGRYDIHDYHELAFGPKENPELVLESFISGLKKTPDRIIVALPSQNVTIRNLHLPTRDKKAIQSGVGFELEDELPFSTEDSLFDYTILSQGKQGSHLHIAATLKRHLVSSIMKWENGSVNPDVITTEVWAYRALLNRVLAVSPVESPVLLVNIGHERTSFYVQWRGTPTFFREFPSGGKDLTQALADRFRLTTEEAETAKKDRGVLTPDPTGEKVSPESLEMGQCLAETLEPFYHELRQVELMTKNVTTHSIGQIYLTGGSSLLSGLPAWIENRIKIPTKLLPALSSITTSGVTYSDQTDARFLLAAALTLCLVGNERANCISFRKGEFTKHGKTRELNFQILKKPLIAASIVTVTLILSLVIQSSVYRSRLEATNTELERGIKGFFGTISNSAVRNYLSNTTNLKTAVNKELTKQRELGKLFGANAHSPLNFLASLSSSIPKDVVVDMSLFQVGTAGTEPFSQNAPPSASLAFLVANPQTAEKLSVLLGNSLVGLEKGKMEEFLATEGQSKKWKVNFSGKPKEDSYGK